MENEIEGIFIPNTILDMFKVNREKNKLTKTNNMVSKAKKLRNTERVDTTITLELKNFIDNICKENNVCRRDFIRECINEYINRYSVENNGIDNEIYTATYPRG